MSAPARIGVGLEFHTSQLGSCRGPFDFLEYGYHAAVGLPAWLAALQENTGAELNLHPLDVNLAGPVPPDRSWLECLRRDAIACNARALSSDAFYWYFENRSAVWPRPAHFGRSAAACRTNASAIARHVGLPFRIENPPTEWMPDRPDIWTFLAEASHGDMLEICLDLSHLVQYEWNAHRRPPVLPEQFPWDRVSEVHMAGYVHVEYAGETFLVDDHAADIGGLQLSLLVDLLRLRGRGLPPLDVCLEMEPRDAGTIDAMCEDVRRLVAAVE